MNVAARDIAGDHQDEAEIQSGEVTRSGLAAVQPFDNKLIRMSLSGAQIWALLRQQFQQSGVQILQVSGMRFAYRLTSPSTGVIEAVEELPDGEAPKPILDDDSRSYTVAVNSFLAGGGDGFTVPYQWHESGAQRDH